LREEGGQKKKRLTMNRRRGPKRTEPESGEGKRSSRGEGGAQKVANCRRPPKGEGRLREKKKGGGGGGRGKERRKKKHKDKMIKRAVQKRRIILSIRGGSGALGGGKKLKGEGRTGERGKPKRLDSERRRNRGEKSRIELAAPRGNDHRRVGGIQEKGGGARVKRASAKKSKEEGIVREGRGENRKKGLSLLEQGPDWGS